MTHEHIIPKVHHVREEHITRDIHSHAVYHHVQPVIDVQVLPTKHYVPAKDGSGALIEVDETQLNELREAEWEAKMQEGVEIWEREKTGEMEKAAAGVNRKAH